MPPKRTGGLGRGLDALIPTNKKTEINTVQPAKTISSDFHGTLSEERSMKPNSEYNAENSEGRMALSSNQDNSQASSAESMPSKEGNVIQVKISEVEPNRSQPRKNFEEDSIAELAESIRQFGILQPLLVVKRDGYYEIVAGERRWRAAKQAGLKTVPVIVKNLSEQEFVEISLIENIQREDLNPVEEAQAYKRLIEEFSLKQEEIAERVSKSRTAIANSLRLLKLDDRVLQMINDNSISAGHARALLGLSTGDLQARAAMKVFDEKLSVRETEKLVKKMTDAPKEVVNTPLRDTSQDVIFENLENRMKGILGTKVSIQRKKNNKGTIEIEYYSNDELDRLVELLGTITQSENHTGNI